MVNLLVAGCYTFFVDVHMFNRAYTCFEVQQRLLTVISLYTLYLLHYGFQYKIREKLMSLLRNQEISLNKKKGWFLINFENGVLWNIYSLNI